MEGILESKEGQVIVAGTFKGNVVAKSLIIEQTSLFTGKINAEHVRIEGKADADITADHVIAKNLDSHIPAQARDHLHLGVYEPMRSASKL